MYLFVVVVGDVFVTGVFVAFLYSEFSIKYDYHSVEYLKLVLMLAIV